MTARNSQSAAFLRVFRGEPVERPPWTADLSYWISGRKQAGNADPAWDTTDGYLALHRNLGVMPYYDYTHFWATRVVYDASVKESWRRENSRSFHRLESPAGTLVEEYADLPESACTGCVRHFLREPADLDILLYLLDHRRCEPDHVDDYFARMASWTPYDGVPCLGLPRSPLASFCYEWAGVESAAYLLADEEDKVRRILERMERQEQATMDAVCRVAPPIVHFPDNLDSENLTGLYDTFLGPTHRRRLERLHGAGVRAAVHLDGAVRGLLPKLAAAGFDAIEALTPAPAGDATVEEMTTLAGGANVILWGGVPGAMFAPPYTWDDMRRHVEHVLRAWRNVPFILGVADQAPPDGDVGFVRRIADLARECRL